mgnify:CR=1 FL=1
MLRAQLQSDQSGNIVGVGPDPVECVDTVRTTCFLTLLGHHDYAIVQKPVNVTAAVERALTWSRAAIESGDPEQAAQRWTFLQKLNERYDKNGLTFVHGSPRDPVSEYVFPEDCERNQRKIVESFEMFEKVLFIGNNHVPGVFREDLTFTPAIELEHYFHYRKGEKVMISVGSVGLPRDGDPRACWIEINKNEMTWHRIQYDVESVAARVEAEQELPSVYARRLREAF